MEMIPVRSGNILSVGYDPLTQVLRVEFSNGNRYEYFDVPEAVWSGLMNPPEGSHGRYFSQNIKGVFRYARL